MFTIIKALLDKFKILSIFSSLYSSFRVYLIGGAVIGVFAGLGYMYFEHTEHKIADLNEQVVQLQVAKQAQDLAIQKITAQAAAAQKANDELVKKNSAIEASTSKLGKFFSSHDLDKSIKSNPGLVEQKVNNATKRLWDDFEVITQPEGF